MLTRSKIIRRTIVLVEVLVLVAALMVVQYAPQPHPVEPQTYRILKPDLYSWDIDLRRRLSDEETPLFSPQECDPNKPTLSVQVDKNHQPVLNVSRDAEWDKLFEFTTADPVEVIKTDDESRVVIEYGETRLTLTYECPQGI